MREFINARDEGNGLFQTCKVIINDCPLLRELLTALTLFYYHVLRPFLIASGCETVHGYKQLSHGQLIPYYTALLIDLRNLSDDSTSLFTNTSLSHVNVFPHLKEVGHKGYQHMFTSVFEMFKRDLGTLDVELIKDLCSSMAEKYWSVFHAAISKNYLSHSGVIQKSLRENPQAWDGVPICALSMEHTVGFAMQAGRKAPTALIGNLGNQQVINDSGVIEEVLVGKTYKELQELFSRVRKSPTVKMYKKIVQKQKNDLHQSQVHQSQKHQKKCDKEAEKKRKCIEDVKVHGGPCMTYPELLDVLSRCSLVKQNEILRLEFRYQKLVVADRCLEDELFTQSKRQSDNSVPLLPLEIRLQKMEQILAPKTSEDFAEMIPRAELTLKLTEIKRQLKLFNGGRALKDRYVAVFWDEPGDQKWFPGLIVQDIKAENCEEEHLKPRSKCFMIQYFGTVDINNEYELTSSDEQWHTEECQIFRYLTLDESGNSSKIKFIDTVEEILLSLSRNMIYKKSL